MRLNRTLAYGLACLYWLDQEGRDRNWVALSHIARHDTLPKAYCNKVLSALVHAGMVRSVRGKGYRLAKPLDKISAWDVMEAFTFNGAPRRPRPEVSLLLYESLREQVNKWLVGLTLEDIVHLAGQDGNGCSGGGPRGAAAGQGAAGTAGAPGAGRGRP